MKKQDKIVIVAAIAFLAYTLTLSLFGPVVSSLQASKTLGNTGSVTAIGVEVYQNSNGSNPVTSFNWGQISPNSTKTETCYIENTGNQSLTLSMSASSWSPTNCTQYMTLSWNLAGATLSGGQIKTAVFTLTVSPTIQGITNFSFDVTIVGSS
jgi:hypothetical protein